MKKSILLTLSVVFLHSLFAQERSYEEMQNIAISKIYGTVSHAKGDRGVNAEMIMREGNIALLKVGDDAAVFVSIDAAFRPVLGYVKEGFDISRGLSCCQKWWIREMNRQMKNAAIGDVMVDSHTSVGTVVPVEPFIKTYWDQGVPYNSMTPEIDGTHPPTGCIATALAQIINYRNYPGKVGFMGSFYTDNIPQSGGRIRSTYDYSKMKIAYGNYTIFKGGQSYLHYDDDEALAVATLMRDCGYAVNMGYTKNGSGALLIDAAAATVEKFKYPKESVKYLYRDYFNDEEWKSTMYNELCHGNPILYGGHDEEDGGHAFVIHGMDEDGLLMVNWGWSGAMDGFYAMDLLNPFEYKFSAMQDMIIGLRTEAYSSDKIQSLWVCNYTITRNAYNNLIINRGGIYNYSHSDFCGEVYLMVKDIDNPHNIQKYVIGEGTTVNPIKPMYGFKGESDKLLTSLVTLENGKSYDVYLASRDVNEDEEQYVRTVGGRVKYTISVGEDGTYSIVKNDVITTSISHPLATVVNDMSHTYTITGQAVKPGYKGIVIKDGKKYIFR